MTNSLREWAHGGDRNSSPVEDLIYGGDDLMNDDSEGDGYMKWSVK
jgi:hypothetical protein